MGAGYLWFIWFIDSTNIYLSFHIILITTLAVAVVGVIAGTMLGYAYAYVFWAYVINKELRYKFEGTLAFMIMAVLPMFLMSISD